MYKPDPQNPQVGDFFYVSFARGRGGKKRMTTEQLYQQNHGCVVQCIDIHEKKSSFFDRYTFQASSQSGIRRSGGIRKEYKLIPITRDQLLLPFMIDYEYLVRIYNSV